MAARANVGGRPLWLLEPTTFMNLSGKSVAALARFFKIEPQEILVAHDELDLHARARSSSSSAARTPATTA